MTDRAAQAAAQSDPARNPNFRRAWGNECGVGDPTAPMRAWYASDDPWLFAGDKQRRADRKWRRAMQGVQS